MSYRILQGDVLERLAELPDESVQCVVTSPPYWGLRDYGVPGQIGLEATPEEYVAKMVEVFREVRRVLRKDGTLWLNLGDSYAGTGAVAGEGWDGHGGIVGSRAQWAKGAGKGIGNKRHHPPSGLKPKDLCGIPWRVAFALQADGWWLRSDIIWAKPNPMPESVRDRPTKAHEYVFLLTKSARYYFDQEAVREPMTAGSAERYSYSFGGTKNIQLADANKNGVGVRTRPIGHREPTTGRNIRSVWTIPTSPFPEAHFAVYPEALVEPCIKAGTSEKGCCPTCGKPWERVVESRTIYKSGSGRSGRLPDGKGRPTGDGQIRPGHDIRMGNTPETRTLGWRPACECGGDPVPCVVMDPFAGSGTTLLVAARLGRRAVGIEASAEYAALARDRIGRGLRPATYCPATGDGEAMPLFAETP